MVGQRGLEPLTSRLSGGRSNQLSYWPFLPGCNRIVWGRNDPVVLKLLRCESSILIVLTLVSPQPEDRFDYEYLTNRSWSRLSSGKEVVQPQVPLRLPCYDLVPITKLAVGASLPKVRLTTSGAPSFRGLTGGVYKAQEHIHRSIADLRLLAIPASWRRVAASNPN